MHPEWDYTRAHNFNHRRHKQWLYNEPWSVEELAVYDDPEHPDNNEFLSATATKEQRRKTGFPIYMLEVNKDVPGSTIYPIEDILDYYDYNRENVRWFTNSYAFMVALAIHLLVTENKPDGWKYGDPAWGEIYNYGFEMSSTEEYGHQRANAVFWNGVAIGHGIKYVEPPNCKLMGQHEPLYGYEKVPGVTKMHLEIEANGYQTEAKKMADKLEQIRGAKSAAAVELASAAKSNQKGRIKRAKRTLEDLLNDEVRTLITLNSLNSAYQVTVKHMKDIDGVPRPETINLIPMQGRIEIN